MSFKDIKGQEEAVIYLRKLIEKDKLPPTLLFHGPRGVGKKLTAVTFAKAVNCSDGNGDSCDTCKSCISMDRGVNPNLEIVGENGFGINEVREVIDHSHMPLGAGYKVNIFLDVDKLTIEAFNSMLKYFEEPPSRTINILITGDVEKIPETVRSRSVEIRFKPLSKDVVKQVLLNKGINAEMADRVSSVCMGSLEKAFFLSKEGVIDKRNYLLKETLSFIKHEASIDRVINSFKSLYGTFDMRNVDDYFDDLLTTLNDIIFISVLKEPESVINLDIMGFLVDKFFGFEEKNIEIASGILAEGKKRLLANVNPLHIMMWSLFGIEEVVK